MSNCHRVCELKDKEVINIKNGTRIGYVDDVEINTKEATVIALVIYGRKRFFGLFGREEDVLIRWDNIEIMGEDTILVSFDVEGFSRAVKKRNFLTKLWG